MQQNKTIEIYYDNDIINHISPKDIEDISTYLYENENSISKQNISLKKRNAEQIIQKIKGSNFSKSSTDKNQPTNTIYTIVDHNLSFGIMSELESTGPTLLTSSEATDFVFEVQGIDKSQAKNNNAINSNLEIKDRIYKISKDVKLNYKLTKNINFASNLSMIDSLMNEIIAYMLKDYYLHGISDCKSLIKRIEEKNPLGYKSSEFYESKFKKLLSSIALGMMPSKIWDGKDKIKCGFIFIKENGDIVAFNMNNRNNFETYLLNSTKFDTASSTRHNFASIYNDSDNTMCIDLNLQIRFI